jgi:hypothetical protein
MQTVNFQCGNCGNLMAVGMEFLGQQVRCPHCQQVVVAPAQAGPEPTPASTGNPFVGPASGQFEPTFTPPREPESIFGPSESEDLFGGATAAPRIEMPSHPVAPQPSLSPPATEPVPAESGTLTYLPSSSDGNAPTEPDGSPLAGLGGSASPFTDAPAAAANGSSTELVGAIPRPHRRPSRGGGWFVALVFIPLVFYAIMATVAVAILYNRQQQVPKHPLEQFLPDEEGDNPGAKHLKSLTSETRRRMAMRPLPDELRVHLKETFTIDREPLKIDALEATPQLEVTPLRVERKRVRVKVQGFEKAEECKHDSLVLHLLVRNVSKDVVFRPMDNYFNRKWKETKPVGPPPLTLLEFGKLRFFGGPANWYPRNSRDYWPEWVAETDYGRELKPGEEMKTFVCTDGDDEELVKELDRYHGPLLWRVQLRRGLVRVGEREFPTTTVIGVEFTDQDVEKAG